MNTLTEIRRQRRVVIGLHLITLFLLALHLHVRTLPPTPTSIPEAQDAEAAWWGLWPVTYAPRWAVTLATLLIVGWIVGWWIIETWGDFKHARMHWVRNTQHVILLFVTLFLLIAFYAFPIIHTRWGDAYLLSKAIAWPDPALRLTHSWQAPLDVFLHSQLWLWLKADFGWEDAIPVYRMLSPLAGLTYLVAALGLAREQWAEPGWLTFGLVVSLGVSQLFFGYVENYSFAAAGILLYLWLGLRTLAGQAPLWCAATTLAVTHALHPSTIILAPSLLYCGWQARQTTRQSPTTTGNKPWRRDVLSIVLPMAIVGILVIGLMESGGHGLAVLISTDRPGGGDARLFVPLWATTTPWEHYTMFSWLHLRDFLNEQLLVAPVVLPGLVVTVVTMLTEKFGGRGIKRSLAAHTNHPKLVFLLLATLCYLLFTWVWNPDYGGQRDWDLFSLAAIPAALLLAMTLPGRFSDQRCLQAGTIPLLVLQWLHWAAWVYQNTLLWEWP